MTDTPDTSAPIQPDTNPVRPFSLDWAQYGPNDFTDETQLVRHADYAALLARVGISAINRMENDPEVCEQAVDNSFTGQIAQWKARAETAEAQRDGLLRCVTDNHDALCRAEKAEAERTTFRAVLVGAGYGDIDGISRNTVDQSIALGEAAAGITKMMRAERDALQAENDRLRAALARAADFIERGNMDRPKPIIRQIRAELETNPHPDQRVKLAD